MLKTHRYYFGLESVPSEALEPSEATCRHIVLEVVFYAASIKIKKVFVGPGGHTLAVLIWQLVNLQAATRDCWTVYCRLHQMA